MLKIYKIKQQVLAFLRLRLNIFSLVSYTKVLVFNMSRIVLDAAASLRLFISIAL